MSLNTDAVERRLEQTEGAVRHAVGQIDTITAAMVDLAERANPMSASVEFKHPIPGRKYTSIVLKGFYGGPWTDEEREEPVEAIASKQRDMLMKFVEQLAEDLDRIQSSLPPIHGDVVEEDYGDRQNGGGGGSNGSRTGENADGVKYGGVGQPLDERPAPPEGVTLDKAGRWPGLTERFRIGAVKNVGSADKPVYELYDSVYRKGDGGTVRREMSKFDSYAPKLRPGKFHDPFLWGPEYGFLFKPDDEASNGWSHLKPAPGEKVQLPADVILTTTTQDRETMGAYYRDPIATEWVEPENAPFPLPRLEPEDVPQ